MTSTFANVRNLPASAHGVDRAVLASCVDACLAARQACLGCADACLSEPEVADLARCIRVDLICADVCGVLADTLSREVAGTEEVVDGLLTACTQACRACVRECDRHASAHVHCEVCAAACRTAERACVLLDDALAR